MSSLPRVLFYSLFIFHLYFVFSTKHNTIRGQKFLCGTYSPQLVNITCKFKRINRTTEFWSFDGLYGFYAENLYMNVTIFARQQNLEWRPHMIINYFVDICKYMDGSLINKLVDIIASGLKNSSNFMHACPHSGNFYLRNMTLDDTNFPQIVPPAEIYVDFQYYSYIKGTLHKLQYLRPYLEFKTKGIFYWK